MKVVFTIVMSVLLISGALATPIGLLYSDVKEPVSASSLASYTKTASGTNTSILAMVGFGDSSIEKVAQNAGITKIKHIDKHTFSLPFFIYMTETFTIYGD
ncbi:MAG: TRL-like family protein [Candidatus Margulisbacteria bacterium]|nr:TRL-like family protein [Candidatus Margulisiibacteriota bacterium]